MKYSLLSTFLLLVFSSVAQVEIPETEIEAYRLKSPEKMVAGSVYQADSSLISAFGSADIKTAINYLPGVKMETRGNGGSRRISIRGTSLRSPYSVRNTMFIYDGFVLTEADGNSPVELLDPDLISNIKIISGPAAASYGGAYGGALIVKGHNYLESTGTKISAHNMVESTGSEGLQARMSATILKAHENGTSNISYVQTQNDGYRDWEWNNKKQLELRRNWNGSKSGKHLLYGAAYSGNWALPGAINGAQFDTIPTSSPGLNYDAQVNRNRYMSGYRYATTSEDGWQYKLSALGRLSEKENTYGTSAFYNGFKEEESVGLSSNASVSKEILSKEAFNLQFETSLMYIRDLYDLSEKSLDDELRYDIEMLADMAFVSTSLSATVNEKFKVDAQIGANRRTRHTIGLTRVDNSNTIHNFKSEEISILPRVGFSYKISDKLVYFAQASTGFSDPTVFELVNTDTSELASLLPEESVGAEFGFRSTPVENLNINVVAYSSTVNNAILQKVAENDAIFFENIDGGIHLSGIELAVDYKLNDIYQASCYATLTDHIFGEGTDSPGNYLPGSTSTSTGALLTRTGKFYESRLGARHTGMMYANNSNADTIAAYTVVDFSIRRKLPINLVIEAGAKNLLDTKYSDWVQLNGVYGKLFNPSPPRTFYVSLRTYIK